MIITISGTPGSGKSTVGKGLAKALKMKFISIGDLMKSLADKKKLSLIELSKQAEKDEKIDHYLDKELKKLSKKEKNLVVTTRTGFFLLPKSIKIFVKCNLKIAAERILRDVKKKKRKSESEIKTSEDALKLIKDRLKSEKKRYKKYYGIDYLDEKNYDYILDTTKLDINSSIKKALEYVKKTQST